MKKFLAFLALITFGPLSAGEFLYTLNIDGTTYVVAPVAKDDNNFFARWFCDEDPNPSAPVEFRPATPELAEAIAGKNTLTIHQAVEPLLRPLPTPNSTLAFCILIPATHLTLLEHRTTRLKIHLLAMTKNAELARLFVGQLKRLALQEGHPSGVCLLFDRFTERLAGVHKIPADELLPSLLAFPAGPPATAIHEIHTDAPHLCSWVDPNQPQSPPSVPAPENWVAW